MLQLKKQIKGFTIVELLIVIVVIGILALLVVTTYTGVQQSGRNAERQTDISAMHTTLEGYYAKNTKYPTFANMNSNAWRTANMKGLDSDAIKDPKGAGTGAKTTDTAPYQLGSAAAANIYSYVVTPAGCDNTATDCTDYTLTATLEGGGTFVKSALN